MQMLRHYYISDDLDDLERFEEQLEEGGVDTPQIHLMSLDDNQAAQHQHIHAVKSLLKKDIVLSGLTGLGVGVLAGGFVLLLSAALNLNETQAGWMPFVFLALVLLGFCTWQGGFIGIQTLNRDFTRFQQALRTGKHVFFVDLEPEQEPVLQRVAREHPRALDAGTGTAAPHWIISFQRGLRAIFRVWP